MEAVPVQGYKRVELLYDRRLGRRNSRSDRETHGQKGLNQRGVCVGGGGGLQTRTRTRYQSTSHLSEPVYFRRDTAGEYHLTYPATVITTKKLYYKSSKISRLNMQISHYLIKYALICIHFLYKNLNTGLGHFQNSC